MIDADVSNLTLASIYWIIINYYYLLIVVFKRK